MQKIREKVVVFTGSGISAESGLATFRDSGGLWERYRIEDVATADAWRRNPELVLEFYNARRAQLEVVEPNAAHRAIARLEQHFETQVITQNVDDLHERAGSSRILHVHGELTRARSSRHPELVYDIGTAPIRPWQLCERGSRLRPHIVWFGELVMHLEEAVAHFEQADRVLVAGTSLSVYPVAGLLEYAPKDAEKVIVALELDSVPEGFRFLKGTASTLVPELVEQWCGAG